MATPATQPPNADAAETKDVVGTLCRALLELAAPEEAERFLTDLCTPGELRALAERWHVARLLDAGAMSYREISDATGVSTATIVRVARFLRDEPHQGYRIVLDRFDTRRHAILVPLKVDHTVATLVPAAAAANSNFAPKVASSTLAQRTEQGALGTFRPSGG